jgi:nucleoid-associated protein YgaU
MVVSLMTPAPVIPFWWVQGVHAACCAALQQDAKQLFTSRVTDVNSNLYCRLSCKCIASTPGLQALLRPSSRAAAAATARSSCTAEQQRQPQPPIAAAAAAADQAGTDASNSVSEAAAGPAAGLQLPAAPQLLGASPQGRWNAVSLAFLGDAVWEVSS